MYNTAEYYVFCYSILDMKVQFILGPQAEGGTGGGGGFLINRYLLLYIFLFLGAQPQNIEWFLEDKALSLSYDLAPPPPPNPASCLSFPVRVAGPAYDVRGGVGVDEEPNFTTARKPGPL